MTHWLDFLGALTALISTWFFITQNPLAWPTNLLSIVINIALYYHVGIPGEMSLEVVYAILTFYGWYLWRQNRPEGALLISRIRPGELGALVLLASLLIPLTAYFLKTHFHSPIPWLDATATILSLQAQWLIGRKIMENWLVWFTVNVINIAVNLIKNLPFHGLLMLIYLGSASLGWFKWRKAWKLQEMTP